ncbi:MAG: hypothetical protein FWF66_07465 [Candidatus Bathyarchaeota archaeon]|nr:hypothetical protein [Candidatus Termiticorpusculum sp.]MCL1971271.1 hypothetical protein [Candidatus Termiticorpusculum sp.]
MNSIAASGFTAFPVSSGFSDYCDGSVTIPEGFFCVIFLAFLGLEIYLPFWEFRITVWRSGLGNPRLNLLTLGVV